MSAQWYDALVNVAAHLIAWPVAQAARRLGPIVRVPGVGIVVSGVDIGHEILHRDRDFTKAGEKGLAAIVTQALGPFALVNMDGDAHRQLRARLGDILAPARAEALLQACRAPLDAACLELAAGRSVDLVQVAQTLSGRLTLEMMGATDSEDAAARDIYALGTRIAAALRLHPFSPRTLRRVRADLDRLTGYARRGFESTNLPESSLVHRLRMMGLDYEETRGVLSMFFLAGTLTTAIALPRVVALLIDSGAMATIRSQRDLVSRAVDEGLRLVAPVPATGRVAAKDVTVNGFTIARGSRVVILTANLARDASVFPDPHRLDLHRTVDPRGRYLWYGAGPHFCIGFPLAQRQMNLAVGALADQPGRLRIVRRRMACGVLLPAYSQLHVRLDRT